MNWLRHLNPFYQPPETEVLEQELKKHAREAEQAKADIRANQFSLHMANASMDAIESWRRKDKQGDSLL